MLHTCNYARLASVFLDSRAFRPLSLTLSFSRSLALSLCRSPCTARTSCNSDMGIEVHKTPNLCVSPPSVCAFCVCAQEKYARVSSSHTACHQITNDSNKLLRKNRTRCLRLFLLPSLIRCKLDTMHETHYCDVEQAFAMVGAMQ